MVAQWTDEIIRAHVAGATFADVGGLWGLVNEKVTVAVKAGCRSATMIDISPVGHQLWIDFDRHAQSAGVTEYRKVQGNLDDPELPKRAGTFDFVYCSGVIYHVPNPFYTLARLYALTQWFLLLGSMTVPRRIHTEAGEISFAGGRTILLPALDRQSKGILAQHFRGLGIELAGVTNDQYLWTSASAYGPWWWLWTEDTLTVMLQVAGFRVIDARETWTGRAHRILCEKVT